MGKHHFRKGSLGNMADGDALPGVEISHEPHGVIKVRVPGQRDVVTRVDGDSTNITHELWEQLNGGEDGEGDK